MYWAIGRLKIENLNPQSSLTQSLDAIRNRRSQILNPNYRDSTR